MKEIRYPTPDWLDSYIIKHGGDYETAEQAWWDNEIDHDRPTPFDLTEEQAKTAKEMTKGARAVDAYGKARKRERKPDEVKREVIATVAQNLPRCWVADGEVKVTEITTPNPEREIRFRIGSDLYSLTLTKHRTPKG